LKDFAISNYHRNSQNLGIFNLAFCLDVQEYRCASKDQRKDIALDIFNNFIENNNTSSSIITPTTVNSNPNNNTNTTTSISSFSMTLPPPPYPISLSSLQRINLSREIKNTASFKLDQYLFKPAEQEVLKSIQKFDFPLFANTDGFQLCVFILKGSKFTNSLKTLRRFNVLRHDMADVRKTSSTRSKNNSFKTKQKKTKEVEATLISIDPTGGALYRGVLILDDADAEHHITY